MNRSRRSKKACITTIDLNRSQNHQLHHTNKFKIVKNEGSLILRRGQTFRLLLKFNEKVNPGKQNVSFSLILNEKIHTNDTSMKFQRLKKEDFEKNKWKGKYSSFKVNTQEESDEIECELYTPPSSVPGKYKLVIKNGQEPFEIIPVIFLLFNPWCTDDDVYMSNEREVKEYVLRQNGLIYRGSPDIPTRWHFGQFEEISLTSAMAILEEMKLKGRESPVEVSRYISSKINSYDNNGIIEGNWSGNYDDGNSPSSWVSSTEILAKYMETSKPVKYGQCWVFSGVVTTIMRALGIPCRSVTNFSSVHDGDANCTFDIYLDENDEEIKSKSNDSCWNFHVWNDVWMRRPDLTKDYNGWQAIDATPQEKSGALYRLGPAPLRAIKEGDLGKKYDVKFVLAEVNADKLWWQKNKKTHKWEVIRRDKHLVGQNISTKAVGHYTRQDITNQYKYPEDSILERSAVKKALLKVRNPSIKNVNKDVTVSINVCENCCGGDIKIYVKLKNLSFDNKTCKIVGNRDIQTYNGLVIDNSKFQPQMITLKGGEEKYLPYKVSSDIYLQYLKREPMIRFVAALKVLETDQYEQDEKVVDIKKPELKIENCPSRIISGRKTSLYVTFKNPFNIKLTAIKMYMDGTIIDDRMYWENLIDVPAMSYMRHMITFEPSQVIEAKNKKMVLSLSSKEVSGINGSFTLPVYPS